MKPLEDDVWETCPPAEFSTTYVAPDKMFTHKSSSLPTCHVMNKLLVVLLRTVSLSMWIFITIIFYAWVSEVIDIPIFINPEVLASKQKKTTQLLKYFYKKIENMKM